MLEDAPMNPSEVIRSITDLKRKTKEILDHVHRTQRPLVLTVNGKADAVLMDTKTYEKYLKTSNMMRLLIQAEEDVTTGRTRSMRSFLKDFKHARKISR
jgi:prevent-host-death family protein